MSDAHNVSLLLDPAALLEFKRATFSKHYEAWLGHLGVKWKSEDHFNVILNLMARLDECPSPAAAATAEDYCVCAECYENFVYGWCISTLDDICWSRAVYRENMKLPLDKAMKMRPRRKDCKPMVYEQHGNILHIKLNLPKSEEFLVWTIEDMWKDWVDAAWPVYLKHDYRLGWYIAKSTRRQLRDGSWLPCDVSVAHLFCSCLHGESVRPADGSMLNYTYGNLIRVDNVEKEKDVTDPDKPPQAFQLEVDVAGLDQWRPPKKTNTTHRDTVDEDEDGSLKGRVSSGQASAHWGLDRVVETEGEARAVSSPTQKGLNRKYRKGEDRAMQADIARRSVSMEAECLKIEQARKTVEEKMNAVWAQATSHLKSAQT
jgi:hypothetical protein